MIMMPVEEIEEFFNRMEEIKKSKEFKNMKKILDLFDKMDEIVKQYNDIITPKPKIYTSDGTSELPEGFGEYGYVDGKDVNYYHKHVWVLKNSHTGGEDYQCVECGMWKTVNWNNYNDTTTSWFEMEYFYNNKALGC